MTDDERNFAGHAQRQAYEWSKAAAKSLDRFIDGDTQGHVKGHVAHARDNAAKLYRRARETMGIEDNKP